MGCGKSTIGKKLAKKIGYSFIDLDRYIESKLYKTILEIFNEKGEAEFRLIETKYLKEVSLFEDIVISTGGGTPCFFENLDLMKSSGKVIYLHLEHQALVNRLLNSKRYDRPLLEKLNRDDLDIFVSNKMSEREAFYEQAHIKISALSIDIDELATKIL